MEIFFASFIQPSNKLIDSLEFQVEALAVLLFCLWSDRGEAADSLSPTATGLTIAEVSPSTDAPAGWEKNRRSRRRLYYISRIIAAESKSHSERSAPGLGTPNSPPPPPPKGDALSPCLHGLSEALRLISSTDQGGRERAQSGTTPSSR